MKKISVSVLALIGAASSAFGQAQVEFRLVERTNQTVANAADHVLDYAVQARVVGAQDVGLSKAVFSIQLAGEAEANGTFARGTINAADGTYFPTISTSTTAGKVAGVANAYRYLVGLDSRFNGIINGSSGTAWVQDPTINDIGLITPASLGSSYLNYVDPDGNGAPANGTGQVDPSVLNQYFGANGNWIDIYRFEYTVSNLTTVRTIPVNLVLDPGAQISVFSTSIFTHDSDANVDVWAPNNVDAAGFVDAGPSFSVVPAPASVALLGLGGLVASRRRRA